MRSAHYWILFAIASLGWLAGTLLLPPSMSGNDTFIFRDAGWNLASSGTFESAALIYMRDLTPRLYSHYTPIMPLLFAGYASVFPRNAYAGTVFNLLLGLLAAAVALVCVLRRAPGRLRNLTALAVALLPVVFIIYDRPEPLGLVLSCAVLATATRPQSHPVLIGLLIALVFLAHPFAAVVSGVWVSACLLIRNWKTDGRWTKTVAQIAVAGATAAVVLVPVALLYYSLDHGSLTRFAAHSLGVKTGLGRVIASSSQGGLLQLLRMGATGEGFLSLLAWSLSVSSSFLLAGWAIARRRNLTAHEWLPIAAALICMVISVGLFPLQENYVVLLSFLVPLGMLIGDGKGRTLVNPALALLLWAMMSNSAFVACGFLQRIEQISSYRAAAEQPRYLLSQLPSPDSIVVLQGHDYDFFKPEFHRLIRLADVEDVNHFASVAAVANCYDGFAGPVSAMRPLPEQLKPTDFHLIQADPQHMWITIFGHRVMRKQWGYGCDLYLRNQINPGAAWTHN